MATKVGCPACGKTININTPRCPHCAATLDVDPTQPAAAPVEYGGWGQRYCPLCGTVARPKTRTKGSVVIEVILWLMIILPGLIYSIWRLTTREQVCPSCGAPNMMALDSPKAKAALARQ